MECVSLVMGENLKKIKMETKISFALIFCAYCLTGIARAQTVTFNVTPPVPSTNTYPYYKAITSANGVFTPTSTNSDGSVNYSFAITALPTNTAAAFTVGNLIGNGAGLTNLLYRCGSSNIAAAASSIGVIFSTPFPPGTTYVPQMTFSAIPSAAASLSYSGATTNGFTANVVGASTGESFGYTAWPTQ